MSKKKKTIEELLRTQSRITMLTENLVLVKMYTTRLGSFMLKLNTFEN